MIRLTLAFALLLALASAALAQGTAKVIASCGTPPATYVVGSIQNSFMDQNGNLCVSSSGGGGGGSVTQGTTPWIVSPYSASASWVQGHASATDNTAHTIIAAAAGALKNYITGVQCYRTDTGTSAVVITFNDSASSVMVLPAAGANFAGSGAIQTGPVPLATAAATAFQFTPGSGITTIHCNAQGFTAN